MAEANNTNEVRIKVILDSAKALAKLRQIQAEMDALNSRLNEPSGGQGAEGSQGGVPNGTPPPTTPPQQPSPKGNQEQPKPSPQPEPDPNDKSKWMKIIGGKHLVDAVKDVFNDIITFYKMKKMEEFEKIKSPLRDNYKDRLDYTWVTSSMDYGLRYGSKYAAYGKMIGGQIGTLLGWLGGLITGTLVGPKHDVTMMEERKRQEIEANWLQRQFAKDHYRYSLDEGIGQAAFSYALKNAPSREARINQYKVAASDLEFGEGEYSIKNIESKLKKLEREKKTEGPEYKQLQELFFRQQGKLASLEQGAWEEEFLKNTPKTYQGSEFADSMSQKGMYVGGQVDIGSVNQPIIDKLSSIREVIITSSDRMLDKLDQFKGYDEGGRATYSSH